MTNTGDLWTAFFGAIMSFMFLYVIILFAKGGRAADKFERATRGFTRNLKK